jgi:hypothetical protein
MRTVCDSIVLQTREYDIAKDVLDIYYDFIENQYARDDMNRSMSLSGSTMMLEKIERMTYTASINDMVPPPRRVVD